MCDLPAKENLSLFLLFVGRNEFLHNFQFLNSSIFHVMHDRNSWLSVKQAQNHIVIAWQLTKNLNFFHACKWEQLINAHREKFVHHANQLSTLSSNNFVFFQFSVRNCRQFMKIVYKLSKNKIAQFIFLLQMDLRLITFSLSW